MPNLVMTIIGPDKPGIVEAFAEQVASHNGNWLESRMAHLGGQFAGLLHLSVPDGQVDQLMAGLRSVEGMEVHLQTANAATSSAPKLRTATLDLVGHDRPGIVRAISHVLAEYGVNVEELETAVESAPMSADLLFKATATLGLPDGVSVDDLREALETIASDLMVTVE